MAVCYASNAHVQKLIRRPLARHTYIEIIAGERAGPRPGSVLAAAVQREDAHRASRLRRLKCGFLFFAERAQFARAARDHLLRNLIAQLRRRSSRPRRKRKYVQVGERQPLDERERRLMICPRSRRGIRRSRPRQWPRRGATRAQAPRGAHSARRDTSDASPPGCGQSRIAAACGNAAPSARSRRKSRSNPP